MTTKTKNPCPFGIVDWIMDYEGGGMDRDRMILGFQCLVDSGMAWTLQGHYGRTATAMLDAGMISARA